MNAWYDLMDPRLPFYKSLLRESTRPKKTHWMASSGRGDPLAHPGDGVARVEARATEARDAEVCL